LQVKPLTEEEKKQKLAELRDKMSEKRMRKAEEEAKEAKANELIRRKAGKVRVGTRFACQTASDESALWIAGGLADQRRSEEQTDSEGSRSEAPRFVLPSRPRSLRSDDLV
jgi:hypothetical protein